MSSCLTDDIIVTIEEGNLAKLDEMVRSEGMKLETFQLQDGSNLLHLSASYGSSDLTRTLVASEVNLNAQRKSDGSTPLHLASAAGRLSIVEFLLSLPQIDDTLKNHLEQTPIEVSKSRPIEAAFQYAKSCFVAGLTADLFSAVQKGDAERLKQCMAGNRAKNLMDVNITDSSGETLLHRAVKSGKAELVQECLKIGADPFAKNRKGKLPFEVASSQEIKQLLKEGTFD